MAAFRGRVLWVGGWASGAGGCCLNNDSPAIYNLAEINAKWQPTSCSNNSACASSRDNTKPKTTATTVVTQVMLKVEAQLKCQKHAHTQEKGGREVGYTPSPSRWAATTWVCPLTGVCVCVCAGVSQFYRFFRTWSVLDAPLISNTRGGPRRPRPRGYSKRNIWIFKPEGIF